MSNLQKFNTSISKEDYFQAINITFPAEIAEEVLCQMENIFGSKFQNMYGHIPVTELINSLCLVLNGVSPYQLNKGLEKMRVERFCPSLSDFGMWCRENNEFWTEQYAWVKAINFVNNDISPITVIAKRALDEILMILNNEGQLAAGYAFRAVYKEYIRIAIENGERQIFWNKNMLVENQAKCTTTSLLDMHSTEYHLEISRINKYYIQKGMTPKQARNMALQEAGYKMIRINKLNDGNFHIKS